MAKDTALVGTMGGVSGFCYVLLGSRKIGSIKIPNRILFSKGSLSEFVLAVKSGGYSESHELDFLLREEQLRSGETVYPLMEKLQEEFVKELD